MRIGPGILYQDQHLDGASPEEDSRDKSSRQCGPTRSTAGRILTRPTTLALCARYLSGPEMGRRRLMARGVESRRPDRPAGLLRTSSTSTTVEYRKGPCELRIMERIRWIVFDILNNPMHNAARTGTASPPTNRQSPGRRVIGGDHDHYGTATLLVRWDSR